MVGVWHDTSGYLNKTSGISTAEKIAAIEKLTGKPYDVGTSDLNRRGRSGQTAYNSLNKNGPYGTFRGDNKAERSEDMKKTLVDEAYKEALHQGLYEKGPAANEAEARKLGYLDPHGQYVSRTNRLTGEKDFGIERLHKVTSGNAGLKGNWNRNQAAWQSGIGAVTGFITGGPVGAVVGAGAGYASGKKAQDANRADRKAKYGSMAPDKIKRLIDIARSRAAGAGTFNYTQQVEV